MPIEQIDAQVAEWLRLDKEPETRNEIELLAKNKNYEELAKRFVRIKFGTAGLRAKMQGGTNSMNSLVILQATKGLALYACEHIKDAKSRGVVVGHDHRRNSKRFAELTAAMFEGQGLKVYLLEGLVSTPVVPFSMYKLNAALGVMITASHNPADDNGYKVYWENGVQIIPPHDYGIAARIDQSLEILPEEWETTTQGYSNTETLKAEYIAMIASMANNKESLSKCSLQFTYTAMHGVGLPFVQGAFDGLGLNKECLQIVEEQGQPDPLFPTVKFPNPEEKGALDLAMKHADKINSPIVLANDPDADRFCAAEKINGKWCAFTGDQLGSILGAWALEQYRQTGAPIDKFAMCASTVSSKMLRAVAAKEGFIFRDTLTGFKYLGNEALTLEKEGYVCPFAYEEAIGFMSGRTIRDKDGVSALTSFVELANRLYQSNATISSYLDDLYEQYGTFITSNSYFVCRDPAKIDRIFFKMRYGTQDPSLTFSDPIQTLQLPKTIAGFTITRLRDLTVGYDTSNPPTYAPNLPVDSTSHMISFEIGKVAGRDHVIDKTNDVVVTGTIRTSGTEPKIKFYLEGSGQDPVLVKKKVELVREAIGEELLDWRANQLEMA